MGAENPAVLARALAALLEPHATAQACSWLQDALRASEAGFDRGAFFGRYAGVSRRFPGPLTVSDAAAAQLRERGSCAPERVTAAELARASLLLAACAVLPEAEHVRLATEVFRR